MTPNDNYHIETLAVHAGRKSDPATDQMTGVVESPRFRLTGPKMSFLVGGGNSDDT